MDADRAIVLGTTGDTGKGAWYGTIDRGAHWSWLPDPCLGTIAEGSPFSRMAVGPDGTRWVVCAQPPGTGQQHKELVISATTSRSGWEREGMLEPAGYGTLVYPFSATVAWRTGGRADIFRTDDRTRWADKAPTGDFGGVPFVAIDANTALYFRDDSGTQAVEYLTRDGGNTWSNHPFTAPPG